MCHQCHKDKERVILCSACPKRGEGKKRYCFKCVLLWYPNTSYEDIDEACPACHGNCNCGSCLLVDPPATCLENGELRIDQDTKVEHRKYLLQQLLPFLKFKNDDQVSEVLEAKRKGLDVLERKISKSNCPADQRM